MLFLISTVDALHHSYQECVVDFLNSQGWEWMCLNSGTYLVKVQREMTAEAVYDKMQQCTSTQYERVTQVYALNGIGSWYGNISPRTRHRLQQLT